MDWEACLNEKKVYAYKILRIELQKIFFSYFFIYNDSFTYLLKIKENAKIGSSHFRVCGDFAKGSILQACTIASFIQKGSPSH